MKLAVDIAAYLTRISSAFRIRSSRRQTVTGAVTVTTLPSSINNSLALWQISRTCASGIGRHERNCAIALKSSQSDPHPIKHVARDFSPVEVAHGGRPWRTTAAARATRCSTIWSPANLNMRIHNMSYVVILSAVARLCPRSWRFTRQGETKLSQGW